MFSVGEKVVCIFDYGVRKWASPKLGEIVTVSKIIDSNYIELREFPCPEGYCHRKFSSKYFRKLSDHNSELSEEILESVLTTIEEPVKV